MTENWDFIELLTGEFGRNGLAVRERHRFAGPWEDMELELDLVE